jgi:hypothetical protein
MVPVFRRCLARQAHYKSRVNRLSSIARKLRLIAQSDLAGIDKLRYALNAAGRGAGLAAYRLRGGVNRVFTTLVLRKGTTDFKVFDEIFVERAYAPCVAALPRNLGRVALIDLGANIGLSAVYIAHELGARALQVDQIIAVEPDPDSFRLLSENLRRSGLANRSIAVRAFAGADHACAELRDSGNGAWGMRNGSALGRRDSRSPPGGDRKFGQDTFGEVRSAAGAQVRHRRRRAAAIFWSCTPSSFRLRRCWRVFDHPVLNGRFMGPRSREPVWCSSCWNAAYEKPRARSMSRAQPSQTLYSVREPANRPFWRR